MFSSFMTSYQIAHGRARHFRRQTCGAPLRPSVIVFVQLSISSSTAAVFAQPRVGRVTKRGSFLQVGSAHDVEDGAEVRVTGRI
jgi:hypothetical protein